MKKELTELAFLVGNHQSDLHGKGEHLHPRRICVPVCLQTLGGQQPQRDTLEQARPHRENVGAFLT